MASRAATAIAAAGLLGLALGLGCATGGEDPAPMGDGGDARDGGGDGAKAVPCNGACVGVCMGLCVGVCSERNMQGDCVSSCEGTCIGTCGGTCGRPNKADAGAADRPGDGARMDPLPAPPGTWTDQTHPSTASWPPLNQTGAMVYDSRRLRVVMFGGFNDKSNNTWEWDGRTNTWTLMQQMGGPRPSARMGHALAYDNVRGRVILYGGIDNTGNSNGETWEWDGARETWTQLGPGPFPSRWGHAMAFDENNNQVVMFGGVHRDVMLGDGELLDTWEYDPAMDKWVNWTYPLPGIWPRARMGHAMAHDPSRGLVVMFGGDVVNAGPAGDLWEWSSMYHAWREVSPSLAPMTPGPRVFASLIYVGLGQMVLLSRESPAFLRWTAANNEWRSLSSPPPMPFPRQRNHAVAAWDGYLNTLVVAGGGLAQGAATLSDTWVWKP